MVEPPSLEEAHAQRRRHGWQRWEGQPLSGSRFEVSIGSSTYPKALTCINKAPHTLYGIGSLESLEEGLAIIGARRATPYGLSCAERFARHAAQRGICIISGGARGCDARAHRAALEAGGRTVAFLGGGCDQPYPPSHVPLFQEIIDNGGAVVSENEWNFPALPYTFRARNRLIAGLAKATLIVEAGIPSGTFSTADEALEANREVLAVSGAITSPTSAGANRLIYQGATPIVDDETFDTALSSLFCLLKQECIHMDDDSKSDELPRDAVTQALLAALRAEPLRTDTLIDVLYAQNKRATAPNVLAALARAEALHLVARYPDGRYGPASL